MQLAKLPNSADENKPKEKQFAKAITGDTVHEIEYA